MTPSREPYIPKELIYPGFPESVYLLLNPATDNPTEEQMAEIERRCAEEGILDPSDNNADCAILDTIIGTVLDSIDAEIGEV